MGNIAILLSTYNGGKYVKEQIESIINQTNHDWVLYIRDDGSTDNTIEIIGDFINKYDNIKFIKSRENLGSAKSFMHLLKNVEAKYYMFCDQDDIWLTNKISNSYNALLEIENDNKGTGILVFTDAVLVDEQLNTLKGSFMQLSKVKLQYLYSNAYLKMFNISPGCTYFFNNELKEISLNYPVSMPMHDWWMMLQAHTFGKLKFLEGKYILYRQHDNNVIGITKININFFVNKIINIKKTLLAQNKQYVFLKDISLIKNKLQFFYLKIKFNILRNF